LKTDMRHGRAQGNAASLANGLIGCNRTCAVYAGMHGPNTEQLAQGFPAQPTGI